MAGGGNSEFQVYDNDRRTSHVRDGNLYLRAVVDAADRTAGYADLRGGTPASQCTCGFNDGCVRDLSQRPRPPIRSARLRTAGALSLGGASRLEVRAKMPTGRWLWPAVWLLPEDEAYGAWPLSGEIDVAETRTTSPGEFATSSTLHFGPAPGYNAWALHHAEVGGLDATAFHTYGLVRNASGIFTSVDGLPVLSAPVPPEGHFAEGAAAGAWPADAFDPWSYGGDGAAPFGDARFYLILNLACGGTTGWFSDDAPGKPWSNSMGADEAATAFVEAEAQWRPSWEEAPDAAALVVDYVRVWEGTPDPAPADGREGGRPTRAWVIGVLGAFVAVCAGAGVVYANTRRSYGRHRYRRSDHPAPEPDDQVPLALDTDEATTTTHNRRPSPLEVTA